MTVTVRTKVSTKDIDEAYLRLKNIVKETPLQFDHYLSQKYNCNVYLKSCLLYTSDAADE